jgi:hypothetical protein
MMRRGLKYKNQDRIIPDLPYILLVWLCVLRSGIWLHQAGPRGLKKTQAFLYLYLHTDFFWYFFFLYFYLFLCFFMFFRLWEKTVLAVDWCNQSLGHYPYLK